MPALGRCPKISMNYRLWIEQYKARQKSRQMFRREKSNAHKAYVDEMNGLKREQCVELQELSLKHKRHSDTVRYKYEEKLESLKELYGQY